MDEPINEFGVTENELEDTGLSKAVLEEYRKNPDADLSRKIKQGFAVVNGTFRKVTVADVAGAEVMRNLREEVRLQKLRDLAEAVKKGNENNLTRVMGSGWINGPKNVAKARVALYNEFKKFEDEYGRLSRVGELAKLNLEEDTTVAENDQSPLGTILREQYSIDGIDAVRVAFADAAASVSEDVEGQIEFLNDPQTKAAFAEVQARAAEIEASITAVEKSSSRKVLGARAQRLVDLFGNSDVEVEVETALDNTEDTVEDIARDTAAALQTGVDDYITSLAETAKDELVSSYQIKPAEVAQAIATKVEQIEDSAKYRSDQVNAAMREDNFQRAIELNDQLYPGDENFEGMRAESPAFRAWWDAAVKQLKAMDYPNPNPVKHYELLDQNPDFPMADQNIEC